ncbi:MAG TPA: LytR C-terminal domain-containing protein [Nocardioides sp.]|nr:LytR C-terminal domain-containing protein [Nocardioides sp.]
MDMTASARSAATLVVLAVVFAGGVAWAWGKVTEPFPEHQSDPACNDTLFTAGEQLTPDDVLVSVLNASDEDGLASETMNRLVKAGFGRGGLGNAPRIHGRAPVQVWTSEPDGAVARLVASYLGDNVRTVDQESSEPGVTVVVRDDFPGVVRGVRRVAVEDDITVCSPPGG